MTEIRFYHLQYQSQMQVLPVILSKALDRSHRIIVKLSCADDLVRMNDHLWTFSEDVFLPHGAHKDGKPKLQPIWLTTEDENPNNADVLILGHGVTSEIQGDFTLCCEMLDGHNQDAISAARIRWKTYKEKGFDVTYWQQNDAGAWQKK